MRVDCYCLHLLDSPDSPGHSDTPPFQKGRRRRGGDASRKEEPILLELPELVDPNLHRGLSHSVAGPPKSQLFQVVSYDTEATTLWLCVCMVI